MREEICKNATHLESANIYNDGEEEVVIDFVIDRHEIQAKETIYDFIRFNYPVSMMTSTTPTFRDDELVDI